MRAAALLAAGTLTSALHAQARPASGVRNVVLVHGLFADGSCWIDVIGRLQARRLAVTAVQNPLTTLDAACAEVRRVLAEQEGPTVLVGHSFAGTIISETGDEPTISGPERSSPSGWRRTSQQCRFMGRSSSERSLTLNYGDWLSTTEVSQISKDPATSRKAL